MFFDEDEYDDDNGPLEGVIEDAFNAIVSPIVSDGKSVVRDAVESGKNVVTDRGATLADQLIQSTEFRRVLTLVKQQAQDAVVEETKKNALALGGLAVAAGVAGGTLFKGRAGIAFAAALGFWGVWTIANAGTSPAQVKK